MILDAPTAPDGSTDLHFNGAIVLTWQKEESDPFKVNFFLANNSTGSPMFWPLGRDVQPSLEELTARLPDAPDTDPLPDTSEYYIKVDAHVDGDLVITAVSDSTFQINAAADPPTSVSISTMSTVGSTSSSTLSSSTVSSSSSSTLSPSDTPASTSGSKNTGAIIGAVVGIILAIAFAVIILSVCRYRSRQKRAEKRANRMSTYPYPFVIDSSSSSDTSANFPKRSTSDYSSSFFAPFSPSSTAPTSTDHSSLPRGSMSEPSTIYPSDSLSQRGVSLARMPTQQQSHSSETTRGNSGSAAPTAAAVEDIELRSQLEQMTERVRQLEREQEYWGEQPPGYNSATDSPGPLIPRIRQSLKMS